jgi:hypothetical protein
VHALLLALALTSAAGSGADTAASKKDRYLRDKQAPAPRASECCSAGLHLPERSCQIDPTCRGPARAGDQAAQVVLVRNLWTEERMPWTGPVVLDRAALGSFLRCHATERPGEHPRELVERVLATAAKFDAHRVDIVSGYRNAKYNLGLAKKGREVSRDSQHTRSQAIDFTLPGVDTGLVYRHLLKVHRGGVGYYPVSSFVHVDTGKRRTWRGT